MIKPWISLSAAALMPVLFSGCNSGGGLTLDLRETAEAADFAFEANDVVRLTTASGETFVSTLNITGPGSATFDTTNYTFQKLDTGIHSWKFESISIDVVNNFDSALDANLAGPSELSDTLRKVLLRQPGFETFQRAELGIVMDELNFVAPENTLVFIHPTLDKLYIPDKVDINFQITSNKANLLEGVVEGTFTIDLHGREVIIAPSSIVDRGRWRLIQPEHYIPNVNAELRIDFNEISSGSFVVELTNP